MNYGNVCTSPEDAPALKLHRPRLRTLLVLVIMAALVAALARERQRSEALLAQRDLARNEAMAARLEQARAGLHARLQARRPTAPPSPNPPGSDGEPRR